MQDISEEEEPNGKEEEPNDQAPKKPQIVIDVPELEQEFLESEDNQEELTLFKNNMVRKVNQMKKRLSFINKKNIRTYNDHMKNVVLYFLDQEFGSFEDFFKHVLNYEPTKQKIELLLQDFCDYKPREALLEQGFNNGIQVYQSPSNPFSFNLL